MNIHVATFRALSVLWTSIVWQFTCLLASIKFCYFLNPAYAQKPPFNTHTDKSNGAIGLNLGFNLYLHPYFVFVSSEGSGEITDTHLSFRCCTMQQVLKFCADSYFSQFFQKLKLNDFVSPSQLPDLRKTIHYGKKSIAIRKTLPGTYHRVSSE